MQRVERRIALRAQDEDRSVRAAEVIDRAERDRRRGKDRGAFAQHRLRVRQPLGRHLAQKGEGEMIVFRNGIAPGQQRLRRLRAIKDRPPRVGRQGKAEKQANGGSLLSKEK